MLLTLTTTHRPATDLGYLLHKNPARVQTFELAFGTAHVFYPEANEDRCTAALLLAIDPVGLVRRRGGPDGDAFALQQYVNDRPYVATSFTSVALAQVFGQALSGRSKERPELAQTAIPLEAKVAVVASRGGDGLLHELFEPLGYELSAERHALDPCFPEWGDSPYYTLTLRRTCRLCELLSHLYVLLPVLDNDKHYWVGRDELEKLLRKGEGWLAAHPLRRLITARYLKHQPGLLRAALARLAEEDAVDPDEVLLAAQREEETLEAQLDPGASRSAEDRTALADGAPGAEPDDILEDCDAAASSERPSADAGCSGLAGEAEAFVPLHRQRHAAVIDVLRQSGARSVLDLGCSTGKLLRELLREPAFSRVAGLDVAHRSLELAAQRLRLDRLPERVRARLELIHGSLTYHDERLRGFDAAVVVEVIEHLDPPRLAAFERVLLEFAKPRIVVITTPNREYNVMWPALPAGRLRHRDHRFEWTRAEFAAWAARAGDRFGYQREFHNIGPRGTTLEGMDVGTPTQMGVFRREL